MGTVTGEGKQISVIYSVVGQARSSLFHAKGLFNNKAIYSVGKFS